jgi:hypothetical protein
MEELIKLNLIPTVELITNHNAIKGHKGNGDLLITLINCVALDHKCSFTKYYVALI